VRILYIIHAFSWGGAEKLVYDLSARVKDSAGSVGVTALYRTGNETEAGMVRDLESRGVVTQIVGKRAGKDRVKTVFAIARFAKEHRVELIHGHCAVPMLFAKIVGKLLGIPSVCTIHNTKGYSRTEERLTGWMTDRYVSIGAAAEAYMETELGIAKERIVRIYNAIDTSQFQGRPRNAHFWEQYGGRVGEQILLNVARVHEQKNQMCLARAVKRCLEDGYREFKVYILGAYDEGDPAYRELANYIHAEKLDRHIVFLGMHKNVRDFLANADLFVMTSAYEGLSVAYLEAVISGLPIVVTDMPFVHELNEVASCATVIAQNDSEALARIIEDRSYKRQNAETIAKFEEMFSMEKFVDEHRNLYLQVIRARAAKG